MSTAATKDNKRIAAPISRGKALAAVRKAQDKLTNVAEALEAARGALKHIRNAERIAQPTAAGGAVKRDALPGTVRRRLKRLGDQLEALQAEIKAVPVTRDQALARKRQRLKGKEG